MNFGGKIRIFDFVLLDFRGWEDIWGKDNIYYNKRN